MPRRTHRKSRFTSSVVSLISLMLVVGTFLPAIARASVLSVIIASVRGNIANAEAVSGSGSIQSVAALKPAMNIDPTPAKGGGDITIVDDSALVPEEGPSGTLADIEKPKSATISVYVVREGDTIASIGKLFGVSPNTILWANDLTKSSALKVGDTLTILPITGIKYTVKKGDTLASIAKAAGGDATEIATYNGIDDTTLTVGDVVIIPDGEVATQAPASSGTKSSTAKVLKGSHASGSIIPLANNPAEPAHNVGPVGTSAEIGYYIAPLAHYIQTQGIHGYNAVDLAAPMGTPIMAAATGDVIVAKAGGYNGGYGSYVVIQHANGSQTLYGHMSKVATYDGQHVIQGQVIGYVGTTGDSTGPHVHFEIRNGIRNPF